MLFKKTLEQDNMLDLMRVAVDELEHYRILVAKKGASIFSDDEHDMIHLMSHILSVYCTGMTFDQMMKSFGGD